MSERRAILRVNQLQMHFPVRAGLLLREVGKVRAVDNVSFDINEGETLGLVGESGCGKSTLGRSVIRIYKPTGGEVLFDGQNVAGLKGKELMGFRRQVQMIFQDPYSSLNPRMTIGKIIETPLNLHNVGEPGKRRAAVAQLLERVGLGSWALDRYPHEFSGGQRQRVAIARALAVKPRLIIADEPVSALDVSVQAQILNLLKDLQKEYKMAYLFIAHDLAVVKHMADRIAVMYLGKIVEQARRDELFNQTQHPYTKALIRANPIAGKGRKSMKRILDGDVPSPLNPPPGCYFNPRCPSAVEVCRQTFPRLEERAPVHLVACHVNEGSIRKDPLERGVNT